MAILASRVGFLFVPKMPSEVDKAKRSLVSLLKALAAKHDLALIVTRESPDAEACRGCEMVALPASPDKG